MKTLLFLLLAIMVGLSLALNKSQTIHFGAFVPYMFERTFGYTDAINMAVAQINNRTDILPDYNIKIHFSDTSVSTI